MQFAHATIKDCPPLMQIHRTSFLDIKVSMSWPFATDQIDSPVQAKQYNVKFSVQSHNHNQWLSQCYSPGPWEKMLNALVMSSYPPGLPQHAKCESITSDNFQMILSHFRALG